MLVAAHRGNGSSVGTPDVCNTPTGATGTAPVTYVNTGQNAQATPFSAKVLLTKQNALYLASRPATTSGDEAGTAHGTIKGTQGFTTGNPVVFIEGQPGVHLTSATNHNNSNCPTGTTVEPSATTVLYTRRSPLGRPAAHNQRLQRFDRTFTRSEHLAFLQRAARTLGHVSHVASTRCAHVEIVGFGRSLVPDVDRALALLQRSHAVDNLVLDLRNNPGGELRTVLQLAGWCIGENHTALQLVHDDAPPTLLHSIGPQRYAGRLTIWLSQASASAAELFAGCLQQHGRARVTGHSAGKAAVQCLQRGSDGQTHYRSVAEARLPDGTAIDGVGVGPQV